MCSFSNLGLGSSWLYLWYSSSLRRLDSAVPAGCCSRRDCVDDVGCVDEVDDGNADVCSADAVASSALDDGFGDEETYSQWQPGLELEEGNWLEDYNYIRPGDSSIRDEAYRDCYYETTHPRPYSLAQAIEYWNNRRRQLINNARQTIHCPTRHSSEQISQRMNIPRTTPGTSDNCTDNT